MRVSHEATFSKTMLVRSADEPHKELVWDELKEQLFDKFFNNFEGKGYLMRYVSSEGKTKGGLLRLFGVLEVYKFCG